MLRKIRRNRLKVKQGNNKIRLAWRKLQVKRMGWLQWLLTYKRCKLRSYTKDDIYMV